MHLQLIRNMVCHRCVLAVQSLLHELNITYEKVVIGEIHLKDDLTADQLAKLNYGLDEIGLELIDNRMSGLIEKIKQLVRTRARNEAAEKERKMKLSAYLSQHLHHEYTYLSSFFSSVEGQTIENYFIRQRIEKAKELIVYNESTLSQIAFDLEYSSVAHLSNQFKQITGLTPTHFRKVGSDKRKLLDGI